MNWNLEGSIYERSSIKIAHFVPIHLQTWLPQEILVSDWLVSKKSSPLKPSSQMKRNLVFISNFPPTLFKLILASDDFSVKLMQEEALIDMLPSYHAAPGRVLYWIYNSLLVITSILQNLSYISLAGKKIAESHGKSPALDSWGEKVTIQASVDLVNMKGNGILEMQLHYR